ncbi:hypothetical protein D3093_34995 (plasmid) [Azospirillum argentinense]|uniref:Uncharacterized protein n=1 Tax=Azospirillum argentinense TaxID=2970906 RepID=A0A4D8PUG0_9PROT|nr:hypothetical protein D3093_34995 [Azospirillum argentinense]
MPLLPTVRSLYPMGQERIVVLVVALPHGKTELVASPHGMESANREARFGRFSPHLGVYIVRQPGSHGFRKVRVLIDFFAEQFSSNSGTGQRDVDWPLVAKR